MRAPILLNGESLLRSPGTTITRIRPAARACAAWLACAATLAGVCRGAPHAEVSWRDLESRIQYGYYTEDAVALRGAADSLASDEGRSQLHGYYAGLLAWRLAQLAGLRADSGRAAAAEQAERCVGALDATLESHGDFAEGLALRGACRATALDEHGLQSGYEARHARRDLERALRLAAHNPRVLLLDALTDYQLAPRLGGNRERALVKARQAVAAFEGERAGNEPLPGWGAAEAYLLLGRDLLDHGETVAARDALEHALLLAPEFAPARRLLAQIIGG